MAADELCGAASPEKKSKTRIGASIHRALEFIADPPPKLNLRFVSVSGLF